MSVPKHIAIIMDGNGRWAEKKRMPRINGHRKGAEVAGEITEACAKLGVEALTLYAFSSENWKRPKREIDALMDLFERALRKKSESMRSNNIKFNVIGRVDELPISLIDEIKKVKEITESNSGIRLTLAVNYGGRQEIVDAIKRAHSSQQKGETDLSKLNEKEFEKFLDTKDLPELDLIIRTSGEMRLSNFLLWQSAYSEIYVTDILWPDFNETVLKNAIDEYEKRNRRFGE